MTLPPNNFPTKLPLLLPPPGWLCIWDVCNPDIAPVRASLGRTRIRLDSQEPGNPLYDLVSRSHRGDHSSTTRPWVRVALDQVCGGGLEVRVVKNPQNSVLIRNGVRIPERLLDCGFELVHGHSVRIYVKSFHGFYCGPLAVEYFLHEEGFTMPNLLSLPGEEEEKVEPVPETPAMMEQGADVEPTDKKKPPKPPMKFLDLPEEIHRKIFSLCSQNDVLYNVSPTCKQLNCVVWRGVPFRRVNLPHETRYTSEEMGAFGRMIDSCSPSEVVIDSLDLLSSGRPSPQSAFFVENLGKRATTLKLRFSYLEKLPLSDVQLPPPAYGLAQQYAVIFEQLVNLNNDQDQHFGHGAYGMALMDYLGHNLAGMPNHEDQEALRNLAAARREAIEVARLPKLWLSRVIPAGCFELLKVLEVKGDFHFLVQEDCIFENLEELWLQANKVNLAAIFGEHGDKAFPKLKSLGVGGEVFSEPKLGHKTAPKALERLRFSGSGDFPLHLVARTVETLDMSWVYGYFKDVNQSLWTMEALENVSIHIFGSCNVDDSSSAGDAVEELLQSLPSCIKFLKLRLSHFSNKHFGIVARKFDQLEYFHGWFDRCGGFSARGVGQLLRLRSLKGIRIREGATVVKEARLRDDLVEASFLKTDDFWKKKVRQVFRQVENRQEVICPRRQPQPEELYNNYFKKPCK